MKRIFTFLILLSCCINVFAQRVAGNPSAVEDAKYITDHYTKIEKQIPMRDGKKLFTSIYLPKDQSQKYGIIMTRTPYNVAPYGDQMKSSLGQNMLLAKEGF